MTQVIKVIKGNRYYYYQDIIKRDEQSKEGNKVITTCIGRSDLDHKVLIQKRQLAFVKHFIKILKETISITKKTEAISLRYHFEHKPTKINNSDIFLLDFISLIYQQINNNLLPEEREDFEKRFFIKYVHGTTAIEGNTLTEEEAGKLLSTGLTSQNKTINETLEVANYNDVRRFIEECRREKRDITENLIKRINKLLMNGITGENGKPIQAGEYRTIKSKITGVWFEPASPELIEERMHYLLAEYRDGIKNNIHPIELASIFHQRFEEIHPFSEGNGRTGREILNFMLTSSGYPPIYIQPQQRSQYLDALEHGNQSDYVPLIDFFITRINATMVYFHSKTKIFNDIMMAEDYKQFIFSIGGEDAYMKFIERLKYYNESQELP